MKGGKKRDSGESNPVVRWVEMIEAGADIGRGIISDLAPVVDRKPDGK